MGIDDIDERGALPVDGLNRKLTPCELFIILRGRKAREEDTFEVYIAEKVSIPRKIPSLKFHKAMEKINICSWLPFKKDGPVVGNELDIHLVGGFEEECLMGRHLVEDHSLDGRLT